MLVLQITAFTQVTEGYYNQKLNLTQSLMKENGGVLNIKYGDTIGGVFSQYIVPIFSNSTVFQSFAFHAIEAVGYHGVACVLDPKSKYFQPHNFKDQIYKIDSVSIRALYVIRKPDFKDTIILEIVIGDPLDTTETNAFMKIGSKFMSPKFTGSKDNDSITGLTASNKIIFKKVIDKSLVKMSSATNGEDHLWFNFYTGGIEVPANNIVSAYIYYKTGDTTYFPGATYHMHDISGQPQTMNSFSPHVYQQYNININDPSPLFYDPSSYSISYSNASKTRYMEWTTPNEILNYALYPDQFTGYDIAFSVSGDFVQPLVNDIIAGKDQIICKGDTIKIESKFADKYIWSTGDTVRNINVNPTITTSYKVTAYQGSQSATDLVKITVYNPIADAGENQTICKGGTAILSAKTLNYYEYKWSTGSTDPYIFVKPTQTTTYRLTVSYANCKAIDDVIVTVGTSIVAKAFEDQTICSGGTATLYATGGDSCKWSYYSSIKDTIKVKPLTTTTYSLTVYSGECSATDKAVITIGTSITANAGEDITVNQGDSVKLAAKGGDKFKWSTSDVTKELKFIASSTRNFTVTVYSGSCSATDDVKVTVNADVSIEEKESIFKDNNITVYPNPANEYINISFKTSLDKSINISVYDYMGKEVYQSVIENNSSIQTIDISNLNKGLYFINLRNNELAKTIKFIKQ